MFFLPRSTTVCEKVFQDEGISADVSIGEFPLDFIPFDYDVLSLELDTAFRVRRRKKNYICSSQCQAVQMSHSINMDIQLQWYITIARF